MRALPEEMRREQEAREPAAEPEVAAAKGLEAPRRDEPDDQTEAEEEDADLVLQSERRRPRRRRARAARRRRRGAPTASRQASAQKSRSKTFIDSTDVSPSTIGESPTASPVKATAKLPPPMRRAIDPATATVPAPASAARRRIVSSESPKTPVQTAVTRGDERRMVDIAPVEARRAGEVVELVAEDAVGGGERRVQGEHGERRPPKSQALPIALAVCQRSSLLPGLLRLRPAVAGGFVRGASRARRARLRAGGRRRRRQAGRRRGC